MKRRQRDWLLQDGVVVDLETTGLSPETGARIIEIGAVRIKRGNLAERFQCLMDPGIPLPEETTDITGITMESLHKARTCEEVMPQFLKFVGRKPVIAHRAEFERQFLDAECLRAGLLPPDFRYICTLKIARKRIPGAPNYKLETLVNYLDLPIEGSFHRALTDAIATAHLWLHLQRLVKVES